MIKFSNGHEFDFGCASGAMAFNGDGWWFEQPFRWFGCLRPEEFTVITKTLTFHSRKGNLRWWAPWRAVKKVGGGIVNAVGLTNPGFKWWCGSPYLHTIRRGYKVIVSFAPENCYEAEVMTKTFNKLNRIVGVQLNVSCPNVSQDSDLNHVCEISETVLKHSAHPVVLKLSYQDDYVGICKELDGRLAAVELINSVPFNKVYPYQTSPLARYGYDGGVSGSPIKHLSVAALKGVKSAGVRTPVISGGGIESLQDVRERKALGADGFVFGSLFIKDAAKPNTIIAEYRKSG